MPVSAYRIIDRIAIRLRTIADLPGRWSVSDAKRVEHSYINDDDNPVYSSMVHLLFKSNDMQRFFDNLDKIEALQNRELKIERMRADSLEFDALMKMVDFTMEMAD